MGGQISRTEEGEVSGSEGLKRTDWIRMRRRRRRVEEMTEMAVVTARARYDDVMSPRITAVITVGEFCFKGCGL